MGAGLRGHWVGHISSICLVLSVGLVLNAVQANSIEDGTETAFGIDKIWVGIAVAALAGVVIFGGIRQIARCAEIVVPFMAVVYLGVALYVIAVNIADLPAAIGLILRSAFGLEPAVGGVAGGVAAAMLNGVKRGLFSNEAGMGSAPNIAAVATPDPHHPSAQGFVQALGVFIDTLLICTATAIMILLSDRLVPGSGVTGTQLTQEALIVHIGPFGAYFIAIAIFFFAFTSIVGNYAYAENALMFLKADTTIGISILRCGTLAMVVWGAYESVGTVFNAADTSMGLMAVINLVAICLLSGTVAKLTRDYVTQRRTAPPVFHAADYPELAGEIDEKIWTR